MALVHTNAAVSTTPALIFQMPAGIPDTAVQICNNHTAVIYIGDNSVSTSGATRGSQIAVNATQQLWLRANDQVWAVSTTTGTTGAVSLLYSGI